MQHFIFPNRTQAFDQKVMCNQKPQQLEPLADEVWTHSESQWNAACTERQRWRRANQSWFLFAKWGKPPLLVLVFLTRSADAACAHKEVACSAKDFLRKTTETRIKKTSLLNAFPCLNSTFGAPQILLVWSIQAVTIAPETSLTGPEWAASYVHLLLVFNYNNVGAGKFLQEQILSGVQTVTHRPQ